MPTKNDIPTPHLDKLGDEQQEAFNWLKSQGLFTRTESKALTLTGAAGTGKTFLTQAIIEYCLQQGVPIAATATTNQAAKVLQGKLPLSGDQVSTIHSLLGLKLVPDNKGGMRLKKDDDKPLTLPNGGAVLIDEASMESRRLAREIEKIRAMRNISFLHIGDKAQLPPVEKEDGRKGPLFPGLVHPGVELETIHRQALDNPIIVAATAARRGKDYRNYMQIKSGKGVAQYSFEQVLKSAVQRFESDAYDEDPLHCRILAAHNRVVREWNRRITTEIYGDKQKFYEGMWVISMNAWTPHKQVLLHTSQLMKIEGIDFKENFDLSTLYGVNWTGPVWTLYVETQEGENVTVRVLAEAGKESYQAQMDEYKKEALDGKKWLWHKYYQMRNALADIEPAWASTIHKAQGSSIDYVYVMDGDIRSFRPDPQFNIRQALAYVAISRGVEAVALCPGT